MTSDSGVGLTVVAVLALGYGVVNTASGVLALLSAVGVASLVLAFAQAALGVLLVPAGVGVALRAPWGRRLGIVALGGLAVVQLLPLLSGATFAVPLAGILLSATCALYLLLAGEAFGTDDGRVLTEETNPHEFVR
ncbi:hypothetical protein ACFQJ5_15895 [Halomicroarcula sp. GCM10025324]|uniref:hypothetical protein n=1 Tax=Haloarcula TaxID=2237 RepID=UPI0023E75DCD|nr:hypothetical protein [Halomicroarcula sp. ZS-22-S1]